MVNITLSYPIKENNSTYYVLGASVLPEKVTAPKSLSFPFQSGIKPI